MERRFLGSLGIVVLAAVGGGLTSGTAVAQSADVTFTRDVAPILQRACQSCHREGAIAPCRC